MNSLVKSKGKDWVICTIAAFIALIMGILVLATYKQYLPNSQSGTDLAAVLFVGVAVHIVLTFVPLRFAALINVVCYSIAFGIVVNKIPSVIVDYINGIFYQGGSFSGCMVYAVGIFATVLLAIIACFIGPAKQKVA